MHCNEIEQSNGGCNEFKLNIVAKLQNVSWGEEIREKKVKSKQKKKKSWRQILKYDATYKRNIYYSKEETL